MLLPKLELSSGIPKESATFVIIPTILKSREKVQELIRKLEVYSLANKSQNIYFALLGDCAASENLVEDYDFEVERTGLSEIKKLNEKYSIEEEVERKRFPKFNFLYRRRTWNASEKCYLGWERKRGLIYEFNQFLNDGIDKFKINTISKEMVRKY